MVERSRRAVVASAGALSLLGLAGCAGLGDDGNDFGDAVDRTGEDTIDVTVGADNGLSYDPANVVIDVGTTVVWEWTGRGGGHDVVEVDDEVFASDLVDEAGHTFEHTFEEPGEYEYVCTPHQTQGMNGRVEVVE
ncbi:halocyanin-like protein [Halorubrum alkaliphilum]|uniref:Halocyanin-like protein n=1 Tax=Halorubrum alkaliphilum TaxID=261290 RepID=A0A8T4G9L1_9EURY|nr:halocyanin domain-containing protein [Halorubrum alkaliphilum]MBP1921108.1 halocyanin-like protein [Halorubrum alkaliphilum]